MQEIQQQAISKTNAARRAAQRRKQASNEVLVAPPVVFDSLPEPTGGEQDFDKSEDIQPFDELDELS